MRYYLKVLYRVVVSAYNYGKIKLRFVVFTMPPGHFEDWVSLSSSEREMLFRELRFCHVSGIDPKIHADPPEPDAEYPNAFLTECEIRTMSMVGLLDNKFVARHGVQVPLGEIQYKKASDKEALTFLRTRIAMDSKILEETKSDDKYFIEALQDRIDEAVALEDSLRKEVHRQQREAEKRAPPASEAANSESK